MITCVSSHSLLCSEKISFYVLTAKLINNSFITADARLPVIYIINMIGASHADINLCSPPLDSLC